MRIIPQALSRIKTLAPETRQKLFSALLIGLATVLAFGLGRLSVIYGEGSAFQVTYPAAATEGQ